jgi:hypothetical protein
MAGVEAQLQNRELTGRDHVAEIISKVSFIFQ